MLIASSKILIQVYERLSLSPIAGGTNRISTLLFRLWDAKFARSVGQSDENVRRCCFLRSSCDSAATPNRAVDDDEEDSVLCIESGRVRDRELGSESDPSRAARLPPRGAPPKLNRFGLEPIECDQDMAGGKLGDDGDSDVVGTPPCTLPRRVATRNSVLDIELVDESCIASVGSSGSAAPVSLAEEFHALDAFGVRRVQLALSEPYTAEVDRAVGVLTTSESAAEERGGVCGGSRLSAIVTSPSTSCSCAVQASILAV